MATDVERLIVTLEARTKEFEREMARARNVTVTQLRRIERDMQASATRQQATFARMGTGIQQTLKRSLIAPLAALGGAAGGRALVGFADSFTRMENTLKVAGVQGEALGATLEDLFQIANKHSAPVESLATLYGRLALSQKELNISSQEMVTFTDNVGAALRVSGKSAAESSGALLQLSQALGGGIVRAEEFNSILEGAQPIAQAVANGLDEAGGSIARLQRLVIGGKVSSEAFFRAFMAGGAGLQQQASQAEKTVGQAMTNINNALIEAVGSIDNTTGASAALADAMGEVARQVRLAAEDFGKLKQAADSVVGFFDSVDAGLRKFGQDIGLADSVASEVEKAKAELANLQQFLSDALARGDEKAAAEFQNKFGRRVIELINQLDPGPAFERHGRNSAIAWKRGFEQGPKATVSLGGGAAPGPVITGGLATRSSTVPGAGGGPVAVTVTRPISIEPAGVSAGVESGNRDFRGSVTGALADVASGTGEIAGHASRTADEAAAAGDRVTGAIGQQTASLTSALAAVSSTLAGGGPGAFGGSVGGSQSLQFSVNEAAERQLEALANERQVISAGLQFKQLSPEDEKAAQLRLAQIDLESAQLNQHMGEVSAAFQSVRPMLLSLVASGMDFDQILQRLNVEMSQRLGSPSNNFFSTSAIPKLAGGGAVRGPGGPRSDSVPIMASDGEYVVNAAATKKHRALLEAINSGAMRAMADGGLVARVNASAQRLADGGPVRRAAAASGREVNAPVTIVVNAADAESFRGSEREIARRMAAEIQYAMQGG